MFIWSIPREFRREFNDMYAGFDTLTPVYPSICIYRHDTSLKRVTWPLLLTWHMPHQPGELVNKYSQVILFNDVTYPHMQMIRKLVLKWRIRHICDQILPKISRVLSQWTQIKVGLLIWYKLKFDSQNKK